MAYVDVRVQEYQREEGSSWHRQGHIPKMNRNSFNRNFCGKNATAYGKGVYFAVDASYSLDDTYSCSQGNKYMYLARVVVDASASETTR